MNVVILEISRVQKFGDFWIELPYQSDIEISETYFGDLICEEK